MEFQDNMFCHLVAKMKDLNTSAITSSTSFPSPPTQGKPKITEPDQSTLYEIRTTTPQYVATNSIVQINGYVSKLPPTFFANCLLVAADMTNPLYYQQAGGLVTRVIPPGFTIKNDEDRVDNRPLVEQLQLNTNSVLSSNIDLKSKVLSLFNKYWTLWSHIDGQIPYGAAEGLEFP